MKQILLAMTLALGLCCAISFAKPKSDRVPILYYDQLGTFRVSAYGLDEIYEVYEHGTIDSHLDLKGRVDKITVEIRK